MEKIVTLTFKNKDNQYYDLKFKTNPNLPESIFNLWYRKFNQFLNDEIKSVQTRHSAFNLPDRDRKFLVNKLEYVINTINTSWLGTEYGYQIEDTTIPEEYPVDVHNRVHHHFEILIGRLWDHSSWWNLVMERRDFKLAQTICALNEITHELEELNDIGTPAHLHLLFTFDVGGYSDLDNEPLPPEVVDILKVGSTPGAVYLNYSQTGKTLTEVIDDEDEDIFEDNITTHRITNGSISIAFGGNIVTEEDEEREIQRYITSATDRGIDLTNPEFKLGRPYIGQVITDNIEENFEKLREYTELTSIGIDDIQIEVNSFSDRV